MVCAVTRWIPRWIGLLAFCSLPLLAGTCVTDTLFDYEALGVTGCQLGALTVNNFGYSNVSGLTIPDTAITVTPTFTTGSWTLMFSSSDFDVTGTDSSVDLLTYTFDPGDIRSLEDILNAHSPVFPGLAQITTEDCEDAAFVGATCSTSTDTIVVSDDGHTLTSPASVSFTPGVGTVGIRDTIELDANGASSEFSSFENTTAVPEASTVVPCLLLACLGLCRRCFQRS
jgi:hypothetical protein